MDRYSSDNYRYDDSSRRAVKRSSSDVTSGSRPRAGERNLRETGGPSMYYDARGVRVKKSKLSNSFLRTLLFFVLPYIVVNGLILVFVVATPKIEISAANTKNYRSTSISFTVNSILPVKELEVTMNSEPAEAEKSGNTYTAEVTENGTFYVTATAVNGMTSTSYCDISVLDDTPPVIDETKCRIEHGVLTFGISDTLSGVNFDSIYALSESGEKAVPTSVNRDSGLVTIPMLTDTMSIYFEDMVGNAREASITATPEEMKEEVSEEASEEETSEG